MVMFLLVFVFLLAVGWGLVAYGTAAKSKCGINLDRISCPRCNTALPTLREPRSLRQAMWGGWTCPACGAGVDKWGREVAPIAPPTIVKSEAEMRRLLKRKIILAAPVGFCLMMLIDWTGVTGEGFPSTLEQALYQVVANTAWTVFFTVTFFYTWPYLLDRFFLTEKGRGATPRHEADRKREP